MERLLVRILRFLRARKYTYFPADISVGGVTVTDLHPLGGFHRLGVTKAGRLSFSGNCDGRRVKVYSGYSAAQNLLRKQVQDIKFENFSFPDIIAIDDSLVVEKWIEGSPVSKLNASDRSRAERIVAGFLEESRSRRDILTISERHPTAFCYFRDYLVARIGVWRHWGPVADFLSLWEMEYVKYSGALPLFLSHPDLSAANLMQDTLTGKIVIVDNELLGVGHGWILDARNSLLGADAQANLSTQVPAEFLEKCWRLRLLGSALDAGDFSHANYLCTSSA